MPPDYAPGSRGAELLLRWLRRTKTPQRCLARRLRMTAGAVNQWLQGQTVPTLEHAVDVEMATGGDVPAGTWAVRPRTRKARPT